MSCCLAEECTVVYLSNSIKFNINPAKNAQLFIQEIDFKGTNRGSEREGGGENIGKSKEKKIRTERLDCYAS